MSQTDFLILFGGSRGWDISEWTDSDDRVRGGKSQSYLRTVGDHAVFCGNLDIDTLGGAGFASQRTVGDNRNWDLSAFDGIEVNVASARSDNQRYTFILKDELLPRNPDNGREQSTISWEYEVHVNPPTPRPAGADPSSIIIPWQSLEPTYRGRKVDDAGQLNTSNIKRFSIMMRSFFGTQQGDFSLEMVSVKAVRIPERPSTPVMVSPSYATSSDSISLAKQDGGRQVKDESTGIISWLFGACGKL